MIRSSNWIVFLCLFSTSFCQITDENNIDLEQIYNQPLFDFDNPQINSDSILNTQLDSNQINVDNSNNFNEDQILFFDPQNNEISLELPNDQSYTPESNNVDNSNIYQNDLNDILSLYSQEQPKPINKALILESPGYETLTSTVSLPDENVELPENFAKLLNLIESNMNFNELETIEKDSSKALKYTIQNNELPTVITPKPAEATLKIITKKLIKSTLVTTTTTKMETKTNTTNSAVKLNNLTTVQPKNITESTKSNTTASTKSVTGLKVNSTIATTTVKNILKNPETKNHLQRILTITKNKQTAETKKIPETLSPFDDFYDRSLAIFNRQKKSHFIKKRVHDEYQNNGHNLPLSKGEGEFSDHLYHHYQDYNHNNLTSETVSVYHLIWIVTTLIFLVLVIIAGLFCRNSFKD